MSDDIDPLITAYVSGDLTPEAARAFEQRMAADPALRAEVEGLKAVRALLDEDARWGAQSGEDAPPPHLVDAIVRAEALSRPAELRAAIARAGSAPRPFVQRLSTWLVGGGLAAGAAAALLLVATSDERAPPTATAVAARVAEASAPPPPTAAPAGPTPDVAAAESADAKIAAASPAAEAAAAASGAVQQPVGAATKEGDARRDELFAGGDLGEGVATGGAQVMGGAGASVDGLGRTAGARPADAAPPAEQRAEQEEAAEKPAAAKGDTRKGDVAADVAKDAPARAAASAVDDAESAPAAAPPPPAAAPAPAPAKAAPPATSSTSGGPPPLSPRARELAAEVREKRKAEASTEAKKQAADPAAAERQRAREQAERGKREQDATMALASAARELAAGRLVDALDLFRQAERLDRGLGILGIDPIVGQMRALERLGRVDDVLALVPRLPADAKQPGVGEALLIAARAAEAKGDRATALALYRRAAASPPHKAEAQKAARRLSAPVDDAPAASAPAEPAR